MRLVVTMISIKTNGGGVRRGGSSGAGGGAENRAVRLFVYPCTVLVIGQYCPTGMKREMETLSQQPSKAVGLDLSPSCPDHKRRCPSLPICLLRPCTSWYFASMLQDQLRLCSYLEVSGFWKNGESQMCWRSQCGLISKPPRSRRHAGKSGKRNLIKLSLAKIESIKIAEAMPKHDSLSSQYGVSERSLVRLCFENRMFSSAIRLNIYTFL